MVVWSSTYSATSSSHRVIAAKWTAENAFVNHGVITSTFLGDSIEPHIANNGADIFNVVFSSNANVMGTGSDYDIFLARDVGSNPIEFIPVHNVTASIDNTTDSAPRIASRGTRSIVVWSGKQDFPFEEDDIYTWTYDDVGGPINSSRIAMGSSLYGYDGNELFPDIVMKSEYSAMVPGLLSCVRVTER